MPSIENALLLNLASGLSLGAGWRGLVVGPIGKSEIPPTLLLDGLHVAELRQLWKNRVTPVADALDQWRLRADELLAAGPWSVTDKGKNHEGAEPHDYVSLAKYWWPDPASEDGLPYIRKDGEVNPACYEPAYDLVRLEKFSDAVFTLALWAAIDGDAKHHDRATKLLEVWFIDAGTRQNPSFDHAQRIPGNPGPRGAGVVEARRLIYVAEAIILLDHARPLPAPLKDGLKKWFADFLGCMRESESGVRAAASKNNVGLWYDLQCIAYAWFLDERELARDLLTRRAFKRFSEQVSSDGSFEREVSRAKPHEYASFTLTALAGLAAAGERLDVRLWDVETTEGRSFEAAFEWFQSLPASRELRLGLRSRERSGELDTKESASEIHLEAALLGRVAEARRLRIGELVAQGAVERAESLSTLRDLEAKDRAAENRLREVSHQASLAMAELDAAKKACEALRSDLAVMNEEADRLRLENARLAEEGGKLAEKAQALKRRGTEAEKRLSQRDARLATLEGRAREREEKMQDLRGQLKRIKGRISYRITRPLRLVDRWLQPALFAETGGKAETESAPKKRDEEPSVRPPDTFVLYRILGNDLFPRHAKGQTRENLAFILENEPALPGCEKRWILNRIVDSAEEAALAALLEKHGQTFTRIPFSAETYAGVPFDHSLLGGADFRENEWYKEARPEERQRAELQAYRLKNNYVMNNNGARNEALRAGKLRARWVLPWDGNCFVTAEAWARIRSDVAGDSRARYFLVPMARIVENAQLLADGFSPDASEEPQIILRADTTEEFNEAIPYGRRPKVDLFWRLGVPGPWDKWTLDKWDVPHSPKSPDAGKFANAGWCARLNSGQAHLEKQNSLRAQARAEAIQAMLDHLDADLRKRPVPVGRFEPRVDLLGRFAEDRGLDLACLQGLAEAPLKRGGSRIDSYAILRAPGAGPDADGSGKSPRIDALYITETKRFSNSLIQIANALILARILNVDTVIAGDAWYVDEERVSLECGIRLVRGGADATMPADSVLLAGVFFHRATLAALYPVDVARQWAFDQIAPFVGLRRSGPLFTEDEIVIHLRSGDVFEPKNRQRKVHPGYGQPPLAYYTLILGLKKWSRAHLVYEDKANPVIAELEKYLDDRGIPRVAQSGKLSEDIAYLMRAPVLVGGRGTFVPGVVALSQNARRVYFFENGYEDWGTRCEHVVVVDRDGRYKASIVSNNWNNEPAQRALMLAYGENQLGFRQDAASAGGESEEEDV